MGLDPTAAWGTLELLWGSLGDPGGPWGSYGSWGFPMGPFGLLWENEGKIIPPVIAANMLDMGNMKNYILSVFIIKYI